MGAYDSVEVAVRLGASGHGGSWRAIQLPRSFLFRSLGDAFCALDVSLSLLQIQSSECPDVPMQRMVGLRSVASVGSLCACAWPFPGASPLYGERRHCTKSLPRTFWRRSGGIDECPLHEPETPRKLQLSVGRSTGLTTTTLVRLSDVETSVIKSRASLITPLASRRYPDWPITNTPCISGSQNVANVVSLIPLN
jgi:hypothetical protein